MKLLLLLPFFFFATAAQSQVITNNSIADTALYNSANYVPSSAVQQTNGSFYTLMYRNTTDTAYNMRKLFVDTSLTKLVSKVFYHNGEMDGPFESYQMDKPLTKGLYKDGKFDGERITYWSDGTTIMEKAYFTNGVKSGAWEFYDVQGHLKRKLTYGNTGLIVQDERF